MTDNYDKEMRRCPAGVAMRILGVGCTATLRNWHLAGKIKAEQTVTGRRMYDVADYLKRQERKAKAA